MSKEDSAGRRSWDQTAVVVAVKGYAPWWTLESGRIKVANDGSNTWVKGSTDHKYLIELMQPSVVEEFINRLMMHRPVKK